MSILFDSVLALIFVIKLWSSTHKNIPDYIRARYGLNCLSIFRKYENTAKKEKKVELDLKFLESCKIYNVWPKFLRFKLHRKSLMSSNFYKGWQAKLLSNEINCQKTAFKHIQSNLEKYETELITKITWLEMATIRKHIIRTVQDYTRTTRLTHEKKLHALGVRSHIEPCNPERVIFNYSSVNIPTRVRLLLAFGLDFGLPIFKLDYVKYFFSFEKLAYKLKKVSNNVDHAAACKGLKHLAHKYFYNFKSSKIFSIFSKNDIEILKDFSKIDNII